jgi:hypothetical protein
VPTAVAYCSVSQDSIELFFANYVLKLDKFLSSFERLFVSFFKLFLLRLWENSEWKLTILEKLYSAGHPPYTGSHYFLLNTLLFDSSPLRYFSISKVIEDMLNRKKGSQTGILSRNCFSKWRWRCFRADKFCTQKKKSRLISCGCCCSSSVF